jgi:hypothetical protein
MTDEEEFEAWKKRRTRGEKLESDFQIPIEGFYNFYAVPWNSQQYVKFPCPLLWISPDPKANPVFGASDHVIVARDEVAYEEFQKGYLGTARLTDETRMNKITEYRTELVLPE